MTDRTDTARASPGHAQGAGPAFGVVHDVDGVLRLAPLGRQLVRLRALFSRNAKDRRSPLSMPRLLQALAESEAAAPVFYLTVLPNRLARPLTGLLRRDGYPPARPSYPAAPSSLARLAELQRRKVDYTAAQLATADLETGSARR
ncbi:MAG: hypothetical protein L0H64_21030 [Pseudonocardia sp.]|nr:hypothetical protein [Pseudonocardia sp.]